MSAEVSAARNTERVWPHMVIALLSLIGLGDSIYLTVQHLTGASVRCTLISGCSEVLSSPYSHIGPLPLAAIGAVAYFAVFSLAVLGVSGYQAARRLLLILIALMFLTTLWLLYLQAFVIRHFCQYCLLSAAVTIMLTVVSVMVLLLGRNRT
jgi:uncharacterized membrane protein